MLHIKPALVTLEGSAGIFISGEPRLYNRS